MVVEGYPSTRERVAERHLWTHIGNPVGWGFESLRARFSLLVIASFSRHEAAESPVSQGTMTVVDVADPSRDGTWTVTCPELVRPHVNVLSSITVRSEPSTSGHLTTLT
jgi:hypothetical protein